MNGDVRMSEYQLLSDQMRELHAGVMSLTRDFSEFRGEVRVGIEGMHRRQDATNGRVTSLEADRARMLVNMAAQDAFTPGMFKALDELKQTCARRHERLNDVIDDIREDGDETRREVDQEHNVKAGQGKVLAFLWAGICTIAALMAFAWEKVYVKWLAWGK